MNRMSSGTSAGVRDAAESLARGEGQAASALIADRLRAHAAMVRSEADQIVAALLDGLPESERAAILAHARRNQRGEVPASK